VTYAYDGRPPHLIGHAHCNLATTRSRVTVAAGHGVQYGYNAASQRTAMTLPGNRNVTYAYDNAGRLASLTDWQSRTTTFGYDSDGRRTSINRPNGVVSTYGYDLGSQNTSIAHQNGGNTAPSFASHLRRRRQPHRRHHGRGQRELHADNLNRITGVTYANGDGSWPTPTTPTATG
jgi:YD repeat-containing protein